MTEFSITEVQKIAKLARIRVNDQDIQKYANDLTKILGELEKLEKVNTQNILPLANVTSSKMILREDSVTQENTVEEILKNAKDIKLNYYIVPKVVE